MFDHRHAGGKDFIGGINRPPLLDKTKAAFLMSAAAFSYALIAAVVKALHGLPVFEILFFRSFFGLLWMTIVMLYRKVPLNPINYIGLTARGITGFIAVLFYYVALTNIPLAETVSVTNTYPLIVILLSGLFLKEPIRPIHLTAFVLSFLGAILIVKPSFTTFDIFYASAIGSAVFTAVTYTILKYIRRTESSENVIMFYSGISTFCSIPLMLIDGYVRPEPQQMLLLVGLGAIGAFYQWFVTCAFKYAPAGDVSIYSYLSILFSFLFGLILWNELPSLQSFLGMVLIFMSAYLIYRTKRAPKNTHPLA